MTKPLSEYEKARRYAAKRAANRPTTQNVQSNFEVIESGAPRTNRASDMSAKRAAMLRYRTYPAGGVR
jgi:hypothetical protein